MNIKTLYTLVGIVLVAIVVIFIILKEPEPTPSTGTESNLPPGHPSVDAQSGMQSPPPGATDGSAPSKANVRQDFIHLVEKLKEKVNKNPDDTSQVLDLARLLADAHQLKDALPLFQRYLRKAPGNIEVLLELSICYFNLGDMESARSTTQKILSIDAKNTMAMYNLGAIYANQGKKEEAKSVWNDLAKRFPNSDDAARAKESLARL